ncbi:MAG: hypothetical protein ACLTDR_09395 [Adlercreutzia equolifaciens]
MKKGQRTAVIVGLIICVLVGAGVLTYLFTSGFFNEQPVAEETQRVPLSDARVIAAFDEVAMDAPDISQYAYVSQDALIGPKFSDIVLNEPTNLGAPANQIVTCEATATATFKNKGVEINVPVTLPFEYSNAGETWVPGDLVVGEATAVPFGQCQRQRHLDNLNDILATNDPTYGEAMADASIVKTASDLTIDGGPITVDLSKTVESEADGVKTSELRTSTVTLNVACSQHRGLACHRGRCGGRSTRRRTRFPSLRPRARTRRPRWIRPTPTLRTSGTSSSATRCRCRARFRRWKMLRVFPPATTTPTTARRIMPTAASSWC